MGRQVRSAPTYFTWLQTIGCHHALLTPSVSSYIEHRMHNEDVIAFAPGVAALGLWLMVAGLYAHGPIGMALIALSALIASACMGLLWACRPPKHTTSCLNAAQRRP